MALGRTGFPLGGQHAQCIDNLRTRVFRLDDPVDESTGCCLIRIGEVFHILFGLLRAVRISLEDNVGCASRSMTAISACGQALTWSAPRSCEHLARYAPPYALRVTSVIFGTVASAYAYSILAPCRMMPPCSNAERSSASSSSVNPAGAAPAFSHSVMVISGGFNSANGTTGRLPVHLRNSDNTSSAFFAEPASTTR